MGDGGEKRRTHYSRLQLRLNRMLGNQRALDTHSGKQPYSTPEALKAAEMMKELFVGNIPEDAIALDENAVLAKYINPSKAAFVIDGSWENPDIPRKPRRRCKSSSSRWCRAAPRGEGDRKDLTNLWYASAKSWSDPDKQAVIKELLKRLSSRDVGKLPMRKSAKTLIPMRRAPWWIRPRWGASWPRQARSWLRSGRGTNTFRPSCRRTSARIRAPGRRVLQRQVPA